MRFQNNEFLLLALSAIALLSSCTKESPYGNSRAQASVYDGNMAIEFVTSEGVGITESIKNLEILDEEGRSRPFEYVTSAEGKALVRTQVPTPYMRDMVYKNDVQWGYGVSNITVKADGEEYKVSALFIETNNAPAGEDIIGLSSIRINRAIVQGRFFDSRGNTGVPACNLKIEISVP